MENIYEAHYKANHLLDTIEDKCPNMPFIAESNLDAVRHWLDAIVRYVEPLEKFYKEHMTNEKEGNSE